MLTQVLVELIRVPELAASSLSAASQELPVRSTSSHDMTAYHPGLYLTPLQVQLVAFLDPGVLKP